MRALRCLAVAIVVVAAASPLVAAVDFAGGNAHAQQEMAAPQQVACDSITSKTACDHAAEHSGCFWNWALSRCTDDCTKPRVFPLNETGCLANPSCQWNNGHCALRCELTPEESVCVANYLGGCSWDAWQGCTFACPGWQQPGCLDSSNCMMSQWGACIHSCRWYMNRTDCYSSITDGRCQWEERDNECVALRTPAPPVTPQPPATPKPLPPAYCPSSCGSPGDCVNQTSGKDPCPLCYWSEGDGVRCWPVDAYRAAKASGTVGHLIGADGRRMPPEEEAALHLV